MIAECPNCETEEQVTQEGDEDLTDIVCDGCGKIYTVSLVRMMQREVKYVDDSK